MNRLPTFFIALSLGGATLVTGCELITSVNANLINDLGGGGTSTTSVSSQASTGIGGTTAITSSNTTSTSGAGGVCAGGDFMACTVVADCPPPPSDCVTVSCTAGCCSATDAPSEQPCMTHGGKVCDGAGDCVACQSPNDCPPQATACILNTCSGSKCGTANAAISTPNSPSLCSDNGGNVCDGLGHCIPCLAATDCPAQATACKVDVCMTHACSVTNAVKGTMCSDNGGGVCNDSGVCQAAHCVSSGDCPAGAVCTAGTCVVPTANGSGCTTGATCASTFCSGDNLCCAVSCGPCGTCAGGTTCSPVAANTATANCAGVSACDGVSDGVADCKLLSGQICGTNDQCLSGVCLAPDAGTMLCQ